VWPHLDEESTVPSVALATCREFPLLDDDDRLLLPALAEVGITGVPAVWTDDSIEWASFDAVVVRETWDYSQDRPAFLDWIRRVSDAALLLNPAEVIAWNTDKRYLRDLVDAGLPTVPTTFLEPGDDADAWLPFDGYADYVVKPAVSAGSRDTMRYSAAGDPAAARQLVRSLLEAGRTVMIQPYLEAVDTAGETALLFIGGEFSHAIRKGPLLVRDVEGERVEGLFVQEQIDPREPSDEERDVAHRITEAIPGGLDGVLFARVDLIPGPDGSPQLLELELTEPSLFLTFSAQAPTRLASAIDARVRAGSR
jgi:glutathione synthase/RimK-type ligase-like ATP-grasp enzyme